MNTVTFLQLVVAYRFARAFGHAWGFADLTFQPGGGSLNEGVYVFPYRGSEEKEFIPAVSNEVYPFELLAQAIANAVAKNERLNELEFDRPQWGHTGIVHVMNDPQLSWEIRRDGVSVNSWRRGGLVALGFSGPLVLGDGDYGQEMADQIKVGGSILAHYNLQDLKALQEVMNLLYGGFVTLLVLGRWVDPIYQHQNT